MSHNNNEVKTTENVGLLNNNEPAIDLSDEEEIEINVLNSDEQQQQPTEPTVKTSSSRVYWVDCLRIYASYIVVITHSSWYNLKRELGSWDANVANVYQGSTRACVPFFVMISGIFFLKPSKNLTFSLLFSKYISRMIKCYIFWCIFYAIVYQNLLYNNFSFFLHKNEIISTIQSSILGIFHLWYLSFVIGLYLGTPIYRAIAADRNLAKYTIIISAIAFQLVPTIVYLVKFYTKFEEISILQKFFNQFKFEMAGSYSVYYLLGYLLSTYEFKKKRNIYGMYIIGILGTVLTTFFYVYHTIKAGKIEQTMIDFNSTTVVMSTIGGFIFFKYTVNGWIQPLVEKSWFRKWLSVLSECSFGVYLWHMFVLRVFHRLGFNGNTFAGVYIDTTIGIPINTTMCYIISFIITYIMKKIPLLKALV